MATKLITLSFLSALLLCLALRVHARNSMFFSKFTRSPELTTPTARPAGLGPVPAPKPAGGRFGPGSGMVVQTQESWPAPTTPSEVDKDFEELMDKFDYDGKDPQNEGYKARDVEKNQNTFGKGKYGNDGYNNKERYNEKNDYNNNGYEEGRQGMSDTRFLENGRYYHDVKNDYVDKNKYNTNEYEAGEGRQGMSDTRFLENGGKYSNHRYYNNNGYEKEGRQGMSDTRFFEDGKYFYDVKGENYNGGRNGYAAERGEARKRVGGGSGYGWANNELPNEFDTMEEYYRSQETQGYVP